MSTLMRRLAKLESNRKQDSDRLVVILCSLSGEGQHIKASYQGEDLFRNADETEDQFCDRIEQWVLAIPHDGPTQVVCLSRGED